MNATLLNLSGVSIERLKSFCEIVEQGSIAKASKKNGIEQSQYSRQMRELSQAMKFEIFTREGKFLKLTRNGVRLASLTKAYFEGLSELSGQSQKLVRLGAGESIVRWVIIPRYREIMATPTLRVQMENHRTQRIVEMINAGSLDLGIIRKDAVTDELESRSFATLSYVMMVPRTVLPDKSATTVEAVRRLPLVLIAGEGNFVSSVERLVKRNKLPSEIVARVESFSLAVEMAKVLDAATIVPMPAAKEFSAETFTKVSLEGMSTLKRPLSIVYGKRTAALNPRVAGVASTLSRMFSSALS
jgi:DNA-binding transcriptional LysR family regulator